MTQVLRPTVEVTNDGFYNSVDHPTSAFVSPAGATFPYGLPQDQTAGIYWPSAPAGSSQAGALYGVADTRSYSYKAVSATADLAGQSVKTVTYSGFAVKTDSWTTGMLVMQLAYNATGTIIDTCASPTLKIEYSKDAGTSWTPVFEVLWDVDAGDAGGGTRWLQPREALGSGVAWKLNAYPSNPQVNSALSLDISGLTDTTLFQIRFTVAGGNIVPQGWPSSATEPFFIGAGFQLADVFVTDPTYTAPPPGSTLANLDATIVLKSGGEGKAPGTLDSKVQFFVSGAWHDSYVAAPDAGWDTIPGTNWVDYNGSMTQTENTTIPARCVFNLPVGYTNPRLSISLLADNLTSVSLNGTLVGQQTDNGSDVNTNYSSGNPTSYSHTANFVAGENIITFSVKNYLGRSGLDFLGQVLYTPPTLGGPTGATGATGATGGGIVTQNYDVPILTVGGTAPYAYSIVADAQTTLPLSACSIISPSTLRVNGTSVAAGIYTIHLQVTDANGLTDEHIISVNIYDNTKFSVINESIAVAPTAFPHTGTLALVQHGGSGDVVWTLQEGATTLQNVSITGSTLTYTLNQYGTYTVGLVAQDSLGKLASKILSVFVTTSAAYKLVDGQIELPYVDASGATSGSHNFNFSLSDKLAASKSRSYNFLLNQSPTPIVTKQYAVNKYWASSDSSPYTMAINGTVSGITLGDSAPTPLDNGLTASVSGLSKSAVISGSPAVSVNALAKIQIPLKIGGQTIGTVVRSYMTVPYAGTDLLQLGTNAVKIRPAVVGQEFALNPQKPYYNSPDNSRDITWKARVQAGSTLPRGMSLDKNTGLIYGIVVEASHTSAAIEFVDAQGTVRGVFVVQFDFVNSEFELSESLPIGQSYTQYSGSIFTTSRLPLTAAEVYSGALPAGLILGVSGTVVTLTGSPTESGYFDVWIKVTNSEGKIAYCYKRMEITFVVPLTVVTGTLPYILTGVAYSQQLQAFGGSGVYTWTTATALPSGFTLSASGLLSGTTASTGYTQSLAIVLTDSAGATVNATLPLSVNNSLQILTASPLPNPISGSFYSYTLQGQGGSGTGYIWALDGSSPALPSPMSLNASTGEISGTTTDGAYNQNIVVKLTDSTTATTTKTLNLMVRTAAVTIGINSTGIGVIKRGAAYQGTLAITGAGTSPFVWTSGTLPTGLILSANTADAGATAFITGRTTQTLANERILVTATDAGGATVSDYISFTSEPDIVVLDTSLPQARTGAAYSLTFGARGSNAPFTWSLDGSSPALPVGFTLSSGGVLSGTTASPYSQNIVVRVTDGIGDIATATLNLSVVTSTLAITTTSLPTIPVGQPWTYQLLASGGTSPYTWTAIDPHAGSNTTSLGWAVGVEWSGDVVDINATTVGGTYRVYAYDTQTLAEIPSGFTGTGTFPWETSFAFPHTYDPNIYQYGVVIGVAVTNVATGDAISGQTLIDVSVTGSGFVTTMPITGGPVNFTTTSHAGKVLPIGVTLSPAGILNTSSTTDTFNQDVEFFVTDGNGAVVSKVLRVTTGTVTATGTLQSGIDRVGGTNTGSLGSIGLFPGNLGSIHPRINESFVVYGTIPNSVISQLTVDVVTNGGTGYYSNIGGSVDSVDANGLVRIRLVFLGPKNNPSQDLTNGAPAPQSNSVSVIVTDSATGAKLYGTFNFQTIDTGALNIYQGSLAALPTFSLPNLA